MPTKKSKIVRWSIVHSPMTGITLTIRQPSWPRGTVRTATTKLSKKDILDIVRILASHI